MQDSPQQRVEDQAQGYASAVSGAMPDKTAYARCIREGEARLRTRHNYASRPGRKAAGVFLRSENTEAGSRKTAMRFMRDYSSRRAPVIRKTSTKVFRLALIPLSLEQFFDCGVGGGWVSRAF